MCRGRLLRGRPMPPTWRERVTVSGEGKIDCEKGWERAGLWKHSGRVGDQDVRKEKKKDKGSGRTTNKHERRSPVGLAKTFWSPIRRPQMGKHSNFDGPFWGATGREQVNWMLAVGA